MNNFWKMTCYMTGIPLGLALLLCIVGGEDGLASAAIMGLALIPIYFAVMIVLAIMGKSDAAKAMALSMGLMLLIGLSICGAVMSGMNFH